MIIAAPPRLLGEILVQERLTTPDMIEQALARAKTTGERLGEALVALGALAPPGGRPASLAPAPRRPGVPSPPAGATTCPRRCRSSRTSPRSTCASTRSAR